MCVYVREYILLYLAHENNAHCMAIAMNLLPQALFTITGENVDEKMKVFLQVNILFKYNSRQHTRYINPIPPGSTSFKRPDYIGLKLEDNLKGTSMSI